MKLSIKNLFLLILSGIIKNLFSQVTCVPCDQLGMSINVGSDSNSISIYHSGQYLTHPRSENNFNWEFLDESGNILHQIKIVDNAFANFSVNWSTNDTINVKVHFVNDSAILENGNFINCLFEDQLYWMIDTFPSGNSFGRWTFIHNSSGKDMNNSLGIDALEIFPIFDNKIYDLFGKELQEIPIGKIYIRNRKKYIKMN